MNMRQVGAFVVAVLGIAGCSFPSLSRAAVVRFHGEATDPIGDTAFIGDVRVARPADLVYASVQGTSDALRLTVRFAPGSLDPTTIGAMFLAVHERSRRNAPGGCSRPRHGENV